MGLLHIHELICMMCWQMCPFPHTCLFGSVGVAGGGVGREAGVRVSLGVGRPASRVAHSPPPHRHTSFPSLFPFGFLCYPILPSLSPAGFLCVILPYVSLILFPTFPSLAPRVSVPIRLSLAPPALLFVSISLILFGCPPPLVPIHLSCPSLFSLLSPSSLSPLPHLFLALHLSLSLVFFFLLLLNPLWSVIHSANIQ